MTPNPNTKRILCYGDSLTFGKIPGVTKRYAANERWTGILQNLLGKEYEVIEEGLRGRTTNLDDHNAVGRNGLEYFQSCILSHLPVDLVILLLGTNDLKEKFHRSADEIASVFTKYKEAMTFACQYLKESEPRTLLLSPPIIDEAHTISEWGYRGGEEKSKLFGNEYLKVANEIQADFLDLGPLLKVSPIDGIHLDEENNEKLAQVLAEKVGQVPWKNKNLIQQSK